MSEHAIDMIIYLVFSAAVIFIAGFIVYISYKLLIFLLKNILK